MDMGGYKMINNIPSDEDFARASAVLKKRSRGLSDVREKILRRFQNKGEIHEFFILDCSENSFRAYIFYRWDKQIKEAERTGLASQIQDAVFDELNNVGRGDRNSIDVKFEFDSHENIDQKYEGNYYNRLHSGDRITHRISI